MKPKHSVQSPLIRRSPISLTSNSLDDVGQVLLPLFIPEKNFGDVSVEVVALLGGRVDDGSQADLRRGVDQARVGQDHVHQKLVDVGPETIHNRQMLEDQPCYVSAKKKS